MTSRSDLRENPPTYGPDWPNNGEVHERMRVDLLERAEQAEAAGDIALGEELRERASVQRRMRDECYKEHRRRMMNRRVRRGA
jgi:hypothetical protein